MDDGVIDPQLLLFRRQYLQLFEPDFLAWPPKPLLRDFHVQTWLFKNLFDVDANPRLPSERYQVRVLKPLLAKIEQAIEDPEEDIILTLAHVDLLILPQEISDDLMNHFSSLISSELPSETAAAQQKSYVTFSTPFSSSLDTDERDPTVTILERRNLISGSRTTGFRTWEAALHLATYFLTDQGRAIVDGKSVLELGAGTGFLSVLCAKQLGSTHVTTTDGDEGVVDTLKENLFVNGLDDGKLVLTSVLRWGHGIRGSWVEDDFEEHPYDLVIGADITYDKTACSALVGTLRMLFNLRPSMRVIISAALRNAETFESFRHGCLRNHFTVQEIHFEPKSIREQKALFYTHTAPMKILDITAPSTS